MLMRTQIFTFAAIAGARFQTARRRGWRFSRSTGGIAAVEFALILPLMIAIVFGSVEAARILTFSRRVNLVANTTIQMLTQNSTGTVNYIDLHFAQDSAMVIFPQVLLDSSQRGESWSQDVQISMASVQFTLANPSCTSKCSYNEKVVWRAGPNLRPCGVNAITAASSDASTPSTTMLPPDVFGPGSIVVVDIVYTYKPLFDLKLFNGITMARSAYVAPRYVSVINYSVISGDDGIGQQCP
jgi:Flp pilus assembly protein TadG